MIFISSKILKYSVIVVLCIISYGDQLEGDFVFDDQAAILNNKLVSSSNPGPWTDVFRHDFWGTYILNPNSHKSYRPLTTLTFRIEFQWHGKEASPFWMKATNLCLHILVSCFLLEFGDLFIRDRCRTSFLAAMLFSVHPIHTEAVSGIVGRADILVTLSCMLAIWIYFKAFIEEAYSIKLSVLRISVLTVVGVLFKETGITVLISCIALDLLYNSELLTKGIFSIRIWKEIYWRRLLTLIMSTGIIVYLRMQMGVPTFHLEDNPIAAIENRVYRVINHVFLYSINAWLLICPDWLSFDWAMGCVRIIQAFNDIRLLGVLAHILILFFIAIRILTNNSRRLKTQLSAFTVLTIAPFLPASGIIKVGFVIAERLLYMPSIGWCLFIALGFRKVFKLSNSMFLRSFLKSLFIIVIFIFVLKTRTRAAEWKGGPTLYQSALRICPNNAKVHYNIASKHHDKDMAIAFLRQAINLYPNYDAALMNLGNLFRDRGDLDQAEYFLKRALDCVEITDKRAAAEMNYGIVMVMRKRYDTALEYYQNAIRNRPHYPVCYYNMGNAYLDLKQFDLAQKYFETAISQDPTTAVAWKNLLTLLYNLEKYEQVIKSANDAISILPNEMELHFPMANALAKLKRYDEAEQVFQRLIEKRPGDAVYSANLGVLYHHWKKYDMAIFYYEKALALDPKLGLRGAMDKLKRKLKQSNQIE